MKTFLNCISVGAGGLIGSVLRYLVSLLPIRHSSGLPLLTLGVNVLGAFLIGLIVTLAGKNASLDPRTLLFLQVGVCGGFTTFSSFALETHTLLQGGKLLIALGYICLSVVLCVGATALSSTLVK
ncbi:MAG: fluoride efflux transporter CrcB [Clostridiaceae bacterium]